MLKRPELEKLIEAVDEWFYSPTYERLRIVEWIRSTGRLVEQTDRGDLPGASLSFKSAATLLEMIALASQEVRPALQKSLDQISCEECHLELEPPHNLCTTCKRLVDYHRVVVGGEK